MCGFGEGGEGVEDHEAGKEGPRSSEGPAPELGECVVPPCVINHIVCSLRTTIEANGQRCFGLTRKVVNYPTFSLITESKANYHHD
jgi:hypothetical protein